MKTKEKMKTWKYALLLAGLAAALTACNDGDSTETREEPATPPVAESPAPTDGTSGNVPPADSLPPEENTGGTGSETVPMPENKELEVVIEGMPEKVPAVLTKSDQGYAFYLMERFVFTPEEPGKDMIFHETFPDYYARVEVLPADADLEDLKQNARDTLNVVGNVEEMKGEQISDPTIRENALFFYHANNDEVSRNILVEKKNGALLRFTLNFPIGEASEGIPPRFYPMINSFTVTK